ncbi:hypothetical protein Bca4012_055262 [Brassica carinata]|uniref:Pentatricopeptide repeat-containing protein n=1 Tax=Brassica carinata TaxID=52824 RepID=A0A8X7VVM8_BRACI|nr:hypothetical protein Bca52824_011739 [Brassica carinata]
MQNSGMEIGIITYNIIIEGMCRAGKVEDAWELFCSVSLNLKGVMKPDVRTYTIMIAGFCLKRLKQEAVTLFRKMKEDGPLPNDRIYNELIRAHLRDGDKVSSAELIKEMRSCGFAAEASTFGLVTNISVTMSLKYSGSGDGNAGEIHSEISLRFPVSERGETRQQTVHMLLLCVLVM